jgi:hypothetical protein
MASDSDSLDLEAARRYLRQALGEWTYQETTSRLEVDGDLAFYVPVNQSFSPEQEDMLDKLMSGVLEYIPDDSRVQMVFVFLVYRGSVTHGWTEPPKRRSPQ